MKSFAIAPVPAVGFAVALTCANVRGQSASETVEAHVAAARAASGYVLGSHGHIDAAAGARFLHDKFGARIIMSAADRDLVGRNTQSWPKPTRDMVATDGQQLSGH